MSVKIGGKEAAFQLQNCVIYLSVYIQSISLMFALSTSPTTGDL
jgi:hypothetical protein